MTKFLLPFLFALSVFASDPIVPARLPPGGTWSNICGVTGGIPTGQTIYTNSVAGSGGSYTFAQ